MSMIDDLPGGPMASRPVHFFWIVDASSSMSINGKMDTLNLAIREAIPEMRDVARNNPTAELFVRAVVFANGARWLTSQPTPVEQYSWSEVAPDGLTDLGEALKVVAGQLEVPPMAERALPPVLAVVSDGMPTDDWKAGLAALDATRWGKKAVRLAIMIGDEDTKVLQEFTGNPELVFSVKNAPQLAKAIRWASTVAVKAASDPRRAGAGSGPVPAVPALVLDDDDEDDGWV